MRSRSTAQAALRTPGRQHVLESLERRLVLDAEMSVFSAFSTHPGTDVRVVADVNNDGRPDIVTPTEFGFQVRYKRPSGLEAVFDVSVDGVDGLFGPSPFKVEHVAVGRFDDDGRLDIAISVRDAGGVVSWSAAGRIEVYSSRAGGVFVRIGSVPAKGVVALAAANFDLGDGRDELIAERVLNPAHTPTRLEVRRYVVGGGVIRSAGKLFEWTGVITRPLVTDVDGDGKADVLLGVRAGSYLGDANVQLFHGVGDGTFARSELYRFSTPTAIVGLSVGDVNGDGRKDVAMLSWDGSTTSLSYLAAQNSGGFSAPTSRVMIGALEPVLPPLSAGAQLAGIQAGSTFAIDDIDHDGRVEVRVTLLRTEDRSPGQRPSYWTTEYQITFESDGAGGFTASVP